MFGRVKKICFNIKSLNIALIGLAVLGLVFAIYFGVKVVNLQKEFAEVGPQEKLAKINSYALVLEKFENFKRKEGQEDTIIELERAVLATNSGVLKAVFDEMLLGGNLKKDMDYFLDAVIDSLQFFSK